MSIVSLELLKKHVRADDFTADDEYLLHLLEAAEAYVLTRTNRSPAELEDMNGGIFPPQLEQAVLMTAGHWYNQREAVSGVQMREVPYSLEALIRPWVNLSDNSKIG